jgi:hypothetical protein
MRVLPSWLSTSPRWGHEPFPPPPFPSTKSPPRPLPSNPSPSFPYLFPAAPPLLHLSPSFFLYSANLREPPSVFTVAPPRPVVLRPLRLPLIPHGEHTFQFPISSLRFCILLDIFPLTSEAASAMELRRRNPSLHGRHPRQARTSPRSSSWRSPSSTFICALPSLCSGRTSSLSFFLPS